MKQHKLSTQTIYDLGPGGLATGFGGVMFESEEDREGRLVQHSNEEDFELDTSFSPDTGYFETAISTEKYNNSRWLILDEYKRRKEALKGHERWLKFFKKGFPEQIKDIHSGEEFLLQE